MVSLQEADASTSAPSCLPARRNAATGVRDHRLGAGGLSTAAFTVVPSNGGTENSHGWLQLDTVSVNKITTSIVGTGCYEPGSFTVDKEGAPTPLPAPVALVATARMADRPGLKPAAPVVAVAVSVADRSMTTVHETPDGGTPIPEPPVPAITWTASIVGTGSGTISSSPGGVIARATR